MLFVCLINLMPSSSRTPWFISMMSVSSFLLRRLWSSSSSGNYSSRLKPSGDEAFLYGSACILAIIF